MKISVLTLFAAATSGIVMGIVIAHAPPMEAATVQYGIQVNIDSGSLVPNTYSGKFSYDDVTAIVSTFSFDFDGLSYDQTNDPLANVLLSGPNFLGLIYSVDGSPSGPSFSFIPGTFSLVEASFAYDPNSNPGLAGFGSIVFNRLTPPVDNSTSVPAPLPVVGAAAFLAYSRKLRQRIHGRSAFSGSNPFD
jgi:hypothetical protein